MINKLPPDIVNLIKHCAACIGLVSFASTFTIVEFQERAFFFPPHPGSFQFPEVSDKNGAGLRQLILARIMGKDFTRDKKLRAWGFRRFQKAD